MTKYYTWVFSPQEYGVLALYLIMFEYVRTFASLNMDSSATRFYFDYKDTKRDEYLSTIFWFITFIASVVLIISLFLQNAIVNWISPGSKTVYFATIFTGISAVYVSFLMRVLYNEQKSTLVLKYKTLQTAIDHGVSVILISLFNLGILGRISGQGFGYGLNTVILLRGFIKHKLFKLQLIFNKAMAKETFLLSLPGIIASIQTIAFVYLDRVFIKHYIGDSAVGIYTLGFMLGQGLSLVYEAVSQAILPKVFNDMNANYNKAIAELESFAYKYYAGLIIITIVISLLSPVIVDIFSNDNYSNATTVMPFIMAGFMMGGFYKIPSLVLGYHKKVWFYPFLVIFSFGTNALLNWMLIPKYGIIGAAFASFIGVFIYSIFLQLLSSGFMTREYSIYTYSIYLFILLTNIGLFYG
jgi:O-antigen/teichoic acid export membrane protein